MKYIGAFLLLATLACRNTYMQQAIPYNNKYILHTDSGNMTVTAQDRANRGEGDQRKRYHWLRKDSVWSSQAAWDGKLLHGPYTLHRLNGSLKEMGQFEDGLKTGLWQQWDSKGTLRKRAYWNKGLESGRFWIYGPDGQLQQAGKMKESRLNGRLTTYVHRDSLAYRHYKDGQEVARKEKLWKRIRNKWRNGN